MDKNEKNFLPRIYLSLYAVLIWKLIPKRSKKKKIKDLRL